MDTFLRTCAALALAAALARAAESGTDVSLEREVARYIQLASPAADGKAPGEATTLWKTGIRFKGEDFEVKLGGRLMFDAHWRSSDDFGPSVTEDGFFFRRVRLFMSGTVYQNTEFKVQVDFAGQKEVAKEDTDDGSGGTEEVSNVTLKDVYVGLKNVPTVQNIRVGHFKEPFSLEELTSSKYITFMEQSAPVNAFAPSRNVGFALFGSAAEKKVTWAIGFFRNTDDQGIQTEDGGYNLTLRITGLAVHDEEQDLLIHVGFGFSLRDPAGESARFRARPGTGNGSRLVDTGSFTSDSYSLFGFEAAVVWKSFSFQAEFIMADIDSTSAGDPQVSGFYVQFSYWLTGEKRNYKVGSAYFDRVKPIKNFHAGEAGWGAWEAAFRFDTIDLTDAGLTGGEMDTFTIGLNWHWNPNTRVMFNVVFADVDGVGDLTVVETRFQFDF